MILFVLICEHGGRGCAENVVGRGGLKRENELFGFFFFQFEFSVTFFKLISTCACGWQVLTESIMGTRLMQKG